jgi:hypothetical protein
VRQTPAARSPAHALQQRVVRVQHFRRARSAVASMRYKKARHICVNKSGSCAAAKLRAMRKALTLQQSREPSCAVQDCTRSHLLQQTGTTSCSGAKRCCWRRERAPPGQQAARLPGSRVHNMGSVLLSRQQQTMQSASAAPHSINIPAAARALCCLRHDADPAHKLRDLPSVGSTQCHCGNAGVLPVCSFFHESKALARCA